MAKSSQWANSKTQIDFILLTYDNSLLSNYTSEWDNNMLVSDITQYELSLYYTLNYSLIKF